MRAAGRTSRASGRLIQGSACGFGRPGALVEPAQDQEIGVLQPGFERAPDREPGMAAEARPHDLPGHQGFEEMRIALAVRTAAGCRRAPTSPPMKVAAASPASPSHSTAPPGRCRSRPGPRRRRCGLRDERARERSSAADMASRKSPRRPSSRSMKSARPCGCPACSGSALRRPSKPSAGARARAARFARAGAPGRGTSRGRARRRRRDASGAPAAARARGAPARLRRAGAGNAPAGVSPRGVPAESSTATFQRPSSAATRRASWRSGVTSAAVVPGVSRTSRMLERDRAGLFARAGEVETGEAVERLGRIALELAPLIGRRGGAHRFAQKGNARRSGAGSPRLVPGRGRSSRCAPICREQLAHAVLRMARLQRGPAFLVEVQIEAGQHDGAVVEPRDRRRGVRRSPGCCRSSRRR